MGEDEGYSAYRARIERSARRSRWLTWVLTAGYTLLVLYIGVIYAMRSNWLAALITTLVGAAIGLPCVWLVRSMTAIDKYGQPLTGRDADQLARLKIDNPSVAALLQHHRTVDES